MFAPGFVTGNLIQRFGREPVVLAGMALLLGSGAVALSGVALWQFNVALILLGVGWNFGFVAATTMVTDCHRPEERGKVQALNEFMTFGAVAAASFAAGKLLHEIGWEAVAWSVFPFVGVATLLVLALLLARRGGRVAA
jgi:MFS family permease